MPQVELVKLSKITVRKFEAVKKEFRESHENQILTKELKQNSLDNLKNIFIRVFKSGGLNLNVFEQKKLAVNLAIEAIQTNMNHANYAYFTKKNISSELTEKDAIELFNSIIDEKLRCDDGVSVKKEIELVCTHRNTIIRNRKFSFLFFQTNYTDTADNLRGFINNMPIRESCAFKGAQRFIIKNKFEYNSVTKQIKKNTTYDIQNLSVINNYGHHVVYAQSNLWDVQMKKVELAVENDRFRHPREYTSGKWMLKVEPNQINAVWQKVQKAIISGYFLMVQCFLVKGNPALTKHKVMFYVPDYQDEEYVLETYKNLVKLKFISENEEIEFKADRQIYNDLGEKLFTFSTAHEFYRDLREKKHRRAASLTADFVSPYESLPVELGNMSIESESDFDSVITPTNPEEVVYRYI